MNPEIFLDNNATTKPLPEVHVAMVEAMDRFFGNPSSTNAAGDRARHLISEAKATVAQILGVDASSILFTSGGTEANNLILFSASRSSKFGPTRLVTTSVEHSSILRMAEFIESQGVEVVVLPVDSSGKVDLVRAEDEITPETNLVSVQWANNETGVIQPIVQLSRICQSRGVAFHTDAAQAVGKISSDLSGLHIDFLSMTAHKFHGPQGVGVIYARNKNSLRPMFYGGPQESGLRPGTENLPGVAGLQKAAELRFARQEEIVHKLARLRDEFEDQLLSSVPDVSVNGDRNDRICNTTNLCFHGVDGQALVVGLDQLGIRCSQSSACTNQRPEPSYVLRAMGLSEEDAYSSVRFSFGELNSSNEISRTVEAIGSLCSRLRGFAANLRNPYHATGT